MPQLHHRRPKKRGKDDVIAEVFFNFLKKKGFTPYEPSLAVMLPSSPPEGTPPELRIWAYLHFFKGKEKIIKASVDQKMSLSNIFSTKPTQYKIFLKVFPKETGDMKLLSEFSTPESKSEREINPNDYINDDFSIKDAGALKALFEQLFQESGLGSK